ncbi:MAG: hypothetical protein ACRDRA_06960 [Pseudonocardiaceae bacterium]
MTHDPLPATNKPCLDDLLTTMGITREQLRGMTADDLFAAATQWQDSATIAGTEAERFVFPADGLLDSLRGRPAGLGSLN